MVVKRARPKQAVAPFAVASTSPLPFIGAAAFLCFAAVPGLLLCACCCHQDFYKLTAGPQLPGSLLRGTVSSPPPAGLWLSSAGARACRPIH